MIDTDSLAHRGFTVAPGLIGPAECRALAALWPEQARFRKHIVMQRHGYGQGEYQYFPYPLPEPVERLRQALYPELAAIANRWNEQLGLEQALPGRPSRAGCGSATQAARSGRRRCCCATGRATTTACTATSTASWCSRCRRPCC